MILQQWEITVILVGSIALLIGLIASILGGIIDASVAVAAGATLLSAFIGAYLAFALNDRREAAKKSRENKAAMNRSLFVLARQSNAVENYKRLMAEYKSSEERAFSMPAFTPPSYAELSHDFDGLAFLLESSEPQLMMELSIEQERFEQTIKAIQTRNDFYVSEIQPAMTHKNLMERMLHINAIREALGERLFGGAMDSAKSVFQHVTSTSESLPEMHNRLHNIAKDLFPGAKFISFSILHNQTNSDDS